MTTKYRTPVERKSTVSLKSELGQNVADMFWLFGRNNQIKEELKKREEVEKCSSKKKAF